MKKRISVICPCFNEELVIREFFNELMLYIKKIKKYNWEIIFIDNNSTDKTIEYLAALANRNKSVKVILNKKNYGQIISPYWALTQSSGDAAIMICSDLQEPPSLISKFLLEWENGFEVVLGVKNRSKESFILFNLRKMYYIILNKLSSDYIIKNATGFGLYSREFIDIVKKINDPYPYLRGYVSELGAKYKLVNFTQKARFAGKSKNNFFTLFDVAMAGFLLHNAFPIRASILLGFIIGFFSLMASIYFFVQKILNWNDYALGISPIIISIFFLFGFLFIIIGILGEYLLSVHRNTIRKPYVIERKRINF